MKERENGEKGAGGGGVGGWGGRRLFEGDDYFTAMLRHA